ncbi:MAG: cytochrome P450 [Haloarculaceae archaeon]
MPHTPPGPRGLPVVGDARRFARDPFGFLEALADAYDDVARFRLGPNTLYLLTDPEAVEDVLVRDADRYRKADFGDDAVRDLLGDGLLLAEGDDWRRQRRVWQPSFDPDHVETLGAQMVERTREWMADWEDGDRLAIDAELSRLTVSIIVETMFGVRLDDATARRIGQLLEPVGSRFVPDPMRAVTPDWFPSPENVRYRRSVAVLDRLVEDIVAERRRESEGDVAGEDLLARLLAARDEGVLSERLLRDELMTVLLAGHETTALALTYTFYLLSRHPDARDRLEAEVDDVVGERPPATGDLPELSSTERVLEESMRLYPPVFSLFREPTKPVEHGGYRIPEGDILALPQWTIHRDERWWDAPAAFDPDRFRPDRTAERPRFAYFPFGGGPRACIGRGFAMTEARLVLAAVTSSVRLDAVSEGSLDLEASITTRPADSVEMVVRER